MIFVFQVTHLFVSLSVCLSIKFTDHKLKCMPLHLYNKHKTYNLLFTSRVISLFPNGFLFHLPLYPFPLLPHFLMILLLIMRYFRQSVESWIQDLCLVCNKAKKNVLRLVTNFESGLDLKAELGGSNQLNRVKIECW